MKKTKLIAIFLFAGLLVASCGTIVPEERTLEEYQKEAEAFKRELPESYVVLGECIDTLIQKIYYTNRISPWEQADPWQYSLENINDSRYSKRLLELIAKDTTETFIKVYDLHTDDTSDIDLSEIGWCTEYGISFSYYANGKLYFSVPGTRYGSSLYYINVFSDEVSCIVDGGCVTNIRVEGNKIIYKNGLISNENEAEFTSDYNWVIKEFSIDL